ncbi:MAG TPA: sigma-54 dependent transcriptional regulator [Vicinamibacterales bacterium]|nr:sigma-54 dependent transcriptional regulator [Vicinamibacterales bacterium]
MAVSPPRPTLLVVDDDRGIRELVRSVGERAGFDVTLCADGTEALNELRQHHHDLAAVDLCMPGAGGIDVLRAIRTADLDCQVILMSGGATIDNAVEAIKLGAVDFLTKPLDLERFFQLLGAVREEISRREHLLKAESRAAQSAEFCGMIGRGPASQQLFDLIRRLAPHVRTALITGETGSGKELVARALYRTGPRRQQPFVVVNCSAVVEALFESELFGHVKGSYTGATETTPGLFELADGGTIFLDEVGELPLTVQAKLLRVLETGEVQRVGATTPRRVDVHVLAATNRDLMAEVGAKRFRSDLYYRINVVELTVPPLRDRREDIPYLVAAFVRDAAARLRKPLLGLTPAAERQLMARAWDGNIRELRNTIERACILAEGGWVTERELKQSGPRLPSLAPSVPAPAPVAANGFADGDDVKLSARERDHIRQVLERSGGNKMAAARALGLDRRTLYRRLDRYGLGSIARRGARRGSGA